MTVEELREFLKDEKNKGDAEEIIKSLGYESQEDVSGLKDNQRRLLDEKKKLKSELEEKQKLLDSVDLDAYNEYIEFGSKKDSKGDLKEFNRIKREFEETKKLVESLKKVDSEHNDLIKELALHKAFDQFGIDQRFKNLLTSAFKGRAKVEIDGDKRNVVIDDDGLGLPPQDYIKKWIETDEGRAYLAKPDNKGGGNFAFNSSGNGNKITEDQLNQLTPKQKADFFDKGGEII